MATLKSLKNKYLTVADGTVLGVTTNTENISALSFKLATADSLSKFNLVDGFADDYNDATGVDAATSTNETRNTAGKYYSGIGTATTNIISSSGLWSGDTGSVTFAGSGITVNTGDKQLYVTTSISGDFDVNITLTNLSAVNSSAFGIFRDNETITGNNDFNNMTNIWYWDQPNMGTGAANAFGFGQSNQGSYTYSNGDVLQIERRSGVIKFYDDAVLAHTFSQENSDDMKIIIGWSGVTGMNYTNINWDQYVEVPDDMTLISNAYTAQAAPTTARIIMDEYTSTGSAIVNTDIKAYASRDNGTTYTQITLADQGTIETNHRLLSGSVDISAQPSGTSVKYKIETLNQSATKQTRIYGTSMAWA